MWYCSVCLAEWEEALEWAFMKYGSKWLRRVLVQCALSAVKCRGDSRFKQFYLRVKVRRGHGIAIVVLASKMLGLCIICWFLVCYFLRRG